METSRWLVSVLVLALMMPVVTDAQAPAAVPMGEPAGDGLAIGGGFTPAFAGGLGLWPSVRISAPAGRRVAFDLDAGWMFPETNGFFTTRDVYALQVRLLRARRDSAGSARYWIVGAEYIRGSALDGERQVMDSHAGVGAVKIGYGGDRLYANGMRAAGEIGIIGGGSSAPTGIYASLIVQWRRRR